MKKKLKWLPILLLWCMVGVGCTDNVYYNHSITSIDRLVNTHDKSNMCEYRTNDLDGAIIAPCGWYKIGDYPIRPLDTLK